MTEFLEVYLRSFAQLLAVGVVLGLDVRAVTVVQVVAETSEVLVVWGFQAKETMGDNLICQLGFVKMVVEVGEPVVSEVMVRERGQEPVVQRAQTTLREALFRILAVGVAALLPEPVQRVEQTQEMVGQTLQGQTRLLIVAVGVGAQVAPQLMGVTAVPVK